MGKGSKAPTTYVPTGAAPIDQSHQQLLTNASPYAQALPGQVIPGLQQVSNNVQSNPYFDQALTGAQDANTLAQQQVVPGMSAANQALNSWGNAAGALAPAAVGGAAYADPMLQAGVQGGQAALGIGNTAMGAAANSYAQSQAAQNGFLGAGAQTYDSAMGAGSTSLNAGLNTYNQAQALMPSTTGGAQLAPGVFDALTGMVPGLTMDGLQKAQQQYGMAMGAIPGLTGGMPEAQQLLTNGFDPQQALYNRNYQSTMDKQNAINAMYGLGTSAAGAGLAGDTARNFNLDWQDRQLGRQTAALGAYGTEQGRVADNLTSLLNNGANNYNTLNNSAVSNANMLTNSAVNDYNSLTAGSANNFGTLANAGTNAMATGMAGFNGALNAGTNAMGTAASGFNGALNAGTGAMQAGTGAANQSIDNYRQALTQASQNYQTLAGGAVQNYAGLSGAAGNAYAAAGQQGQNATQLLAAAAAAPGQTYLSQQQSELAALQALAQTGSQSLAPTSTLASSDAQYMGGVNNATTVNQNATSINNANSNAQAAGVGKLVGTVAAIALAPATGGLSLFALGPAAGAAGVAASAPKVP